MKSKVLITLATVFAGAVAWIACEAMHQGGAPGAVPVSEAATSGAADAPRRDAGAQRDSAESLVRGSPAHRAQLAERARQYYDRKVEEWTAAGKSETYIAYMLEHGLEKRLRDIRTKPAEWFTMEAVLERIRALDERDTKLFLDAGFPPEQVAALMKMSSSAVAEASKEP